MWKLLLLPIFLAMTIYLPPPKHQAKADLILAFQEHARRDWEGFAKKWMGFEPWRKAIGSKGYDQYDFIDAILHNERVFLATCHGTGKSTAMVIASLIDFVGYSPNIRIHTLGATFGATAEVFWPELHKWARKMNERTKGLLYGIWGKPNLTEWTHKFYPECYIRGYSPESGEAGQGRKALRMRVMNDEATGTKKPILDALEGLSSSGDYFETHSCNPLSTDCETYRKIWLNPETKKISIAAWDVPQVRLRLDGDATELATGKIIKYRKEMITYRWVERMQRAWALEVPSGDYRDHPMWQARVAGQWPEGDPAYILVPGKWIDEAMNKVYKLTGNLFFGLDLSRSGADRTVLTIFDGKRLEEGITLVAVFVWTGVYGGNLPDRAGAITSTMLVSKLKEFGCKKGAVDVGFNSTVYDDLRSAGIDAMPILFGDPCTRKVYNVDGQERDEFDMLASEMNWEAREAFQAGYIAISPTIPTQHQHSLREDFSNRKYWLTKKGEGVKHVEAKEDFKARQKRSPDFSDSFSSAIHFLNVISSRKAHAVEV